MLGIKIKDSRQLNGGHCLIDLRDVLTVIGEPVVSSQWICRDLEYIAMRDGDLSEIHESRRKLSGAEMIEFADSIHQTIYGLFEARGAGPTKKLWLKIVVFDSSWVEVWSSKREMIEGLKGYFKKVSDLPATTA
jgi:hypothetical protein